MALASDTGAPAELAAAATQVARADAGRAAQGFPPDLDLAALAPAGRALFSIEGMWCPSCAAATERVISGAPGVTGAKVSFATSAALVTWDPARVDLPALFARVARLGYEVGAPVSPDETARRIEAALSALSLRLAVIAFFGMWTMALSVTLYVDPGLARSVEGYWMAVAATLAALPVVAFAGTPILIAGWRTLKAGVPGMDGLVSLGVLAALALSLYRLASGEAHVYADTAVMLIALLSVGRLVEMRTARHAALAIGALAHVLPERARVRRPDGTVETVAAANVPAGALIEVEAGARVPLDGRIVEGDSALDRSVLTGEAMPVPVGPGAAVEAGTVNLHRLVVLRVERPVGERIVDRIGGRIAEVTGGKGEVQRIAERWARVLVPAAVGLAATTLALGLLFGLPVEEAVLRAASVLVVACPCAVGIAVPVAWVAAAGGAARRGILFRSAGALEALAGTRRILFDKTGTLTEGAPRVVAVEAADGVSPEVVRQVAAEAEAGIDHPIARALREGVAVDAPALHTRRHARGASAVDADGRASLVGTPGLLAGAGIAVPPPPAASGRAWIEVARDGRWIGRIALEDAVRPDAAETVATLEAAGLAPAIVTGDACGPALAVASAVGLPPERVSAAQSPEDKAVRVAESGDASAFVGDGINDGVALAAARVGVAVAGAASVASATAGVAIAQGGLDRVVEALAIARRTRRIMVQNLAFAVVYNAAGLTLATVGVLPPALAACAMVASSLTVLANAARARATPGSR